MQFKDGDEVMARWPGSSLFFKAKVLYTLFVSNKLLNGKTDWSQFFMATYMIHRKVYIKF